MRTALTAEAYQSIAERAWSHLLNGGGIVPTAAAVSLEDGIAAIAKDHFDAAAAEAYGAAVARQVQHGSAGKGVRA